MIRRFMIIIIFFAVLSCLLGASGAISTETSAEELVSVIIRFNEPPGQAEQSLITDVGGEVNEIYHIVPAISARIPRDKIPLLSADSRIKCIEEDITVNLASQQLPWGVDRIDADLVHPTNKGAGVKVAVLDTGIDLDHPDLNVAGSAYLDLVPEWASGDDDNGHGTLVAGIIGALDNDIGVIGVAPEAELYSIKVLNQYGSGSISVIIAGVEWAVDNGMDIVNMSLGGAADWGTTAIEALANAYNAGLLIIAGAGNGGNPEGTGDNIWAPARYDSVIAVGATDFNDLRYSSSSTGSTLELMAPGVNIYSTAMGGGYDYISCTSASSPHAAGVASLIIADGVIGNDAIRAVLKNTAEDLGEPGWDSKYGWGLVDAFQAVYGGYSDQTAPSTTIALSGTSGDAGWYVSNVQVTLTATDNEGGAGVAGTKYSLDGGTTWHSYTTPFTISTDGITQLKAKSWDNAGNLESPPVSSYVKIDKTPPVLSETVNPQQIERQKKGKMVNVNYTGTAQDSTSGIYTPTNTVLIDEYGQLSQDLGSNLSGTVSVEAWCNGGDANGRTYTFRLTARDVAGNQATAEAIATVLHP